MTPTTKDIAKAALESAFEMLKSHGLEQDALRLVEDLRTELRAREGSVQAVLKTPSGNSGEFAHKVKAALEKKLGRTVELTEKADASLLGGAILEYGDARIDLSLKGALEAAKLHLEHSVN